MELKNIALFLCEIITLILLFLPKRKRDGNFKQRIAYYLKRLPIFLVILLTIKNMEDVTPFIVILTFVVIDDRLTK